jgi:hypothetical protein
MPHVTDQAMHVEVDNSILDVKGSESATGISSRLVLALGKSSVQLVCGIRRSSRKSMVLEGGYRLALLTRGLEAQCETEINR